MNRDFSRFSEDTSLFDTLYSILANLKVLNVSSRVKLRKMDDHREEWTIFVKSGRSCVNRDGKNRYGTVVVLRQTGHFQIGSRR